MSKRRSNPSARGALTYNINISHINPFFHISNRVKERNIKL
jgi:hypothetical protein